MACLFLISCCRASSFMSFSYCSNTQWYGLLSQPKNSANTSTQNVISSHIGFAIVFNLSQPIFICYVIGTWLFMSILATNIKVDMVYCIGLFYLKFISCYSNFIDKLLFMLAYIGLLLEFIIIILINNKKN